MVLDSSLESFSEPKIFKDVDLFDVVMNIKNNINLHKFNIALKLVLNGKETFKDESLFRYLLFAFIMYLCIYNWQIKQYLFK